MDENKIDLYIDAMMLLVKEQKVSTSFLQRELGIGYNQASKLLEEMEDVGIVSSPIVSGGQRRKVIMSTTDIYDLIDKYKQIIIDKINEETLQGGDCAIGSTSTNEDVSFPNDFPKKDTISDDKIMMYRALEFVLHENRISIPLLQRRMGIGYNRATKIIEQLEQCGIISNEQERNILVSDITIAICKIDAQIAMEQNQIRSKIFEEEDLLEIDQKVKKVNFVQDKSSYLTTKPHSVFYKIMNYTSALLEVILSIIWWSRYLLMLLATIGICYFVVYDSSLQPHNQIRRKEMMLYGNEYMVKSNAKDAVLNLLKCPSTAKFIDDETAYRGSSIAEKIAENKGYDPKKTWIVTGSFDAQNSFGVMLRGKYVAVVVFLGNNHYETIDVNFIE